GPVPDRGRHPGPGRRTPGNPAEMYAGACRSPGYIRCGLQRKGTSGSSKFVTILCWGIVGVKRLCVFLCFRNSREKCVIIQHENSLTHLETDRKTLYSVCVGRIYDEIVKHFPRT